MAIYYLNITSFGRANGSSAVSAAAYRSGERIRDERTGKTYDHTERAGVLHKEIVLPSKFANADMEWARDRTKLWNSAEEAETRKNSRVAREYLVALPVELSPEQRLTLVREFSQELSNRYQFAVDFTLHAPRTAPDSDSRNFHAHLLATTREVTFEGLGGKTHLEFSDRNRYRLGMQSVAHEVVHTRERWASVTNHALKTANVSARIDHRSLAAQGVDREPNPRIPHALIEMERLGYRSHVADNIRAEFHARVERREHTRAQTSEQGMVQAPVHAPVKALESSEQKVRTLEEIRRQARENWLKMRQSVVLPSPKDTDRGQHRTSDSDHSL